MIDEKCKDVTKRLNQGSVSIQVFNMTDEKLCLKWNGFQDIVQTSFAQLKSDTDFTDVTLACEDQTSIKAHKIILSACSPFFKKLLKTQAHPHPLIYMRGMKSNELAAMVDFIYLGEASVFQEQLETFLALAEELELRGLNGSSEEKAAEYPKEYFTQNERGVDLDQKQNKTEGLISNVKYKTKIFEGEIVPIQQTKAKQNSIVEPDTMAQIQSMIKKRIDGYFCTNCDHKSNKISHMREHVESHIEGLEYPCNLCNKVYRSSVSLRMHLGRCPIRNRNWKMSQ